jgi:hypothetical protein
MRKARPSLPSAVAGDHRLRVSKNDRKAGYPGVAPAQDVMERRCGGAGSGADKQMLLSRASGELGATASRESLAGSGDLTRAPPRHQLVLRLGLCAKTHSWGSHQIAKIISKFRSSTRILPQHRCRHQSTSFALPQYHLPAVKMENDRGEIVDL